MLTASLYPQTCFERAVHLDAVGEIRCAPWVHRRRWAEAQGSAAKAAQAAWRSRSVLRICKPGEGDDFQKKSAALRAAKILLLPPSPASGRRGRGMRMGRDSLAHLSRFLSLHLLSQDSEFRIQERERVGNQTTKSPVVAPDPGVVPDAVAATRSALQIIRIPPA